MKETSERLERKIDENTELTQKVLIQATKTNGRATALEDKLEGYPNNVNSINGRVSWIMGVGATFVVLGATVYYLAFNSIQNTVKNDLFQCCQSTSKQ